MFARAGRRLALAGLLQTRFFALFFVFYVSATLLLNIAWQQGWRGIAPPEVYDDELA